MGEHTRDRLLDEDWSHYSLEADGATVSDKGLYTCESCECVLEPAPEEAETLSPDEHPSEMAEKHSRIVEVWRCDECGEAWTNLSRKLRRLPAWEIREDDFLDRDTDTDDSVADADVEEDQ